MLDINMNVRYALVFWVSLHIGKVYLSPSPPSGKQLINNPDGVEFGGNFNSQKLKTTTDQGVIHQGTMETNTELINHQNLEPREKQTNEFQRKIDKGIFGLDQEFSTSSQSSPENLCQGLDDSFQKTELGQPAYQDKIQDKRTNSNQLPMRNEVVINKESNSTKFQRKVGKHILGSNRQPAIHSGSSLGNLYWDMVGTTVQKFDPVQKEDLSVENFLQKDIIKNTFFSVSTMMDPMEECHLDSGEDNCLRKYIFEFFKPNIQDSFIFLEDLHPEAFEWLSRNLQEHEAGLTRNKSEGYCWIQRGFIDTWENKIVMMLNERLQEGDDAIWMTKQEAYRRFEAFRNQFYQKYDLLMWQKRTSKAKSSKKFMSDFQMDKPWKLHTHPSKKNISNTYLTHLTESIPDEIMEVLELHNLIIWMEIHFLRQRSLGIPQNKYLFGDEFLKTMFFQGINVASLIKLDIALELSASKVSWAELDSARLIEKFWCVLSTLVDSTSRDYEVISNQDIGINQGHRLDATLLKDVIKGHNHFHGLVKQKIKLLLVHLSKLTAVKITDLFPSCCADFVKEGKITYDKALAAAISGIDMVTWVHVTRNKPPNQKKSKYVPKLLKKVIYWSQDLEDVEKTKFLEYCDLLDIKLLDATPKD